MFFLAKATKKPKTPNPAKEWLIRNWMPVATMVSLVLAFVVGLAIQYSDVTWYPRYTMYLNFLGTLFIQLLSSVILPLVMPSLIVAIGAMSIKTAGFIGVRMIIYCLFTSFLAVILGIVLVAIIEPGKRTQHQGEKDAGLSGDRLTADNIMDVIRNAFPENLLAATMLSQVTRLTEKKNNPNKYTWPFETNYERGLNMIGLIVWSTLFGIALASIGERGEAVVSFLAALVDGMMTFTKWLIQFTPLGVFFLVSSSIADMKNMKDEFTGLGLYFATVMIGLVIHSFMVLPLIYFILMRKLPFQHIANVSEALLTAFGTASSLATLPVTIHCSETYNNISPQVSRFVLPIAATVNMDGAALYEAVAALFIAQMYNNNIEIWTMVAVSVTATMASIGAAGIPQAGLIALIMVLNSIGLDERGIGFIISVDWLLDRFMTATNVLGDTFAVAIIQKMSAKSLEELSSKAKVNKDESNDDGSVGLTNEDSTKVI